MNHYLFRFALDGLFFCSLYCPVYMIDYNCAKLTSLLIDSEKPLCPLWTITFSGMAAVEVR